MASKHTKFWVIGGVLVAAGAAYWLIFRKNTLANTGPSYNPATPAPAPTPASGGSSIAGSQGNQGTAAKNVYALQAGVNIRTSPQVSDGLFGMWFTNVAGSVAGIGTWMGTISSTVPDSNGDINPSTGAVYKWYKLNLNPSLVVESSDSYYVREEGVTVK